MKDSDQLEFQRVASTVLLTLRKMMLMFNASSSTDPTKEIDATNKTRTIYVVARCIHDTYPDRYRIVLV